MSRSEYRDGRDGEMGGETYEKGHLPWLRRDTEAVSRCTGRRVRGGARCR